MEERDKINIETEFMGNVVSRALEKYIWKKYNYNVDLSIHKFSVVNKGEKTIVQLSADIRTDKKLLKEIKRNNGLIAGGIAKAFFKAFHLC